jgi:hypothetical protein
MSTSYEIQKIRRKQRARVPPRDFLPIAPQAVGDLPLRQYVHSRDKDGGLDSTYMKCFSVVGINTDDLSLLASEREHVCREKCSDLP